MTRSDLPLAPPATAVAVERRPLSLLFADLSGYTELTNTHDPEYVEGLVAPLLLELAAVAVDHGAEVRPPQGDGFLAVFGARTVRDDDPRRAVRAAEAMRERIELRRAVDPAVPGLHVGVASGEVLVRQGIGSLTGPAVNLAARLNDQAVRGDVLVDAACVALCREPGWFGPGQAYVLQGFPQPVVAHRLLPTSSAGPSSGPALQAAAGVVHGRSGELDLLDRAWEEVVAVGTSRVLCVTGDAGMGKTALVETWLARRQGDLVLRAACRDYGHALPLGPLTEAVLSLAEGSAAQLAAQLRGTRGAAPASRLAALLTPADPARPDLPRPREDDESILAQLRELLTELGRGAPLVVLLDDVQHVGDELRRELGHLARQPLAAPVLVLVVGRGDPVAPDTVVLTGLGEPATARLATDLLGGPPDPDLVREVHRRSGGNPLWLRELLELRLASGTDELHVGPGADGSADVPAALRLVVTARLDLLVPEQRALLRQLCVLPDGLPAAALEPAVVSDLVAGGLLRHAGGRVGFVNAVVREVVYGSLPKRERAEAHALLARESDDPAARVHHLTRSWELAVDPFEAAAAAQTALAALLRWAETLQPVHVPSALEALARYRRLRDLQAEANPATSARLASLEAECLLEIERPDQAQVCAQQALDLAARSGEPAPGHRARLVLAQACFVGGAPDEARQHLAPLLEEVDLPARWRGRALCVLAGTRSYELTGYAAPLAEAYDCFVAAKDDEGAGDAARALAWFHSVSGAADFRPWNERAVALTRHDHLRGQVLLARTRAMRARTLQSWEDCRRASEESLAYARSIGSRDLEVWALALLGDAVLALGDEPALRRLDRELQEVALVGRPRQRFNAFEVRFRALVRLGDHAGAQACRAQIEEVLRLLGPAERAQSASTDGLVAFDRGQWADAVRPFERAEWESVQLGWTLSAAEDAMGALLARRRLGDADAPAGLLALAALYDNEDAPAAARLARAAAGQPQQGPALTLAEAAWAAESEAIHGGAKQAWAAAAQAWARLGLSASYALCLERAGDTAEAERVRRLLSG